MDMNDHDHWIRYILASFTSHDSFYRIQRQNVHAPRSWLWSTCPCWRVVTVCDDHALIHGNDESWYCNRSRSGYRLQNPLQQWNERRSYILHNTMWLLLLVITYTTSYCLTYAWHCLKLNDMLHACFEQLHISMHIMHSFDIASFLCDDMCMIMWSCYQCHIERCRIWF
jgi:hypothetical protein